MKAVVETLVEQITLLNEMSERSASCVDYKNNIEIARTISMLSEQLRLIIEQDAL
ncbi:hypothetical protein D922_01238 [Enterococcus faecalis 06-MB-DW-09]|nr:hypothetical protein D922_01238 [Enterococcus faecalis 06-MB-DW-09]